MIYYAAIHGIFSFDSLSQIDILHGFPSYGYCYCPTSAEESSNDLPLFSNILTSEATTPKAFDTLATITACVVVTGQVNTTSATIFADVVSKSASRSIQMYDKTSNPSTFQKTVAFTSLSKKVAEWLASWKNLGIKQRIESIKMSNACLRRGILSKASNKVNIFLPASAPDSADAPSASTDSRAGVNYLHVLTFSPCVSSDA